MYGFFFICVFLLFIFSSTNIQNIPEWLLHQYCIFRSDAKVSWFWLQSKKVFFSLLRWTKLFIILPSNFWMQNFLIIFMLFLLWKRSRKFPECSCLLCLCCLRLKVFINGSFPWGLNQHLNQNLFELVTMLTAQ